MPAETHQHGRLADRQEILTLLSALVGDGSDDVAEDATLASLGINDEAALWDLWDAVREEFGERTLGPADGPELLAPSMTVGAAAVTIVRLLNPGSAGERPMGGDRDGAGT